MRKDGPNAGYFSINTNQVLLLQKIPPLAARSVRVCTQSDAQTLFSLHV